MCLSPCTRSITYRCHTASPRVLWSCGYKWVWVAGHGAWQLSLVLFVRLSLPPLRFLINDWSVSANFASVWGHTDIQFTALSVLNSVILVWQIRVFVFSWPPGPQMLLWVVLPDTVWSELFQRLFLHDWWESVWVFQLQAFSWSFLWFCFIGFWF